jgi:pyrimidine deaminase RibD-like protein
MKYAVEHDVNEGDLGMVLPANAVLYTTMEPCGKRLSGNLPCVERILRTHGEGRMGIKTVYIGVKEPDTFVGENVGIARLEEAGIRCVQVPGLEREILEVASVGHDRNGGD